MNPAVNPQRPLIIGIGGLTSNVGKTTLVCELLHHLPGWEAIKTTRGHYRSCGKDPHTCCVSDLLDTEPVIKSGRELTDSAGKDTGRYWAAGAANVHWVIATDEQVAAGIRNAIDRVKARGVIVEGNSFTEYVRPDFFIMVAHPDGLKIKATARRALSGVSAYYFSSEVAEGSAELEIAKRYLHATSRNGDTPVFTPRTLPDLVELLQDFTVAEAVGSTGKPE